MRSYVFVGDIQPGNTQHIRMWIFFKGPRGGKRALLITEGGHVSGDPLHNVEAHLERDPSRWKKVVG